MALQTEREKGAHLLRRFGLGASEAELDFYLRDGLRGAVDRLLDYQSADEGYSLSYENLLPPDKRAAPMPVIVTAWVGRLLTTRRPLQEKMTLFWHDHFATSGSKVKFSPLMFQQNETLRTHATRDFKTLLTAASKDPAMLFWLDAQENVKGKAQENFAREIMELFTLGIGHYSEKDVQEAARAFTGWTYSRNPRKGRADFLFRRFQHDDGLKTILDQTGPFDGDDVIAILCQHPRTAEYITTKLWNWFVYPDPKPEVIAPFIARFRASRLDVGDLLRAMMLSSEFYSEKAERTVFKSPVDFVVSTQRQLGVGAQMPLQAEPSAQVQRARLFPASVAMNAMKGMGMYLMFPPDVAGWDGGSAWISSATMVERIGWADRLFGSSAGTSRNGRKLPSLRVPAFQILGPGASPAEVAKRLCSIFDAPLAPAKKAKLAEAAAKTMGDRLTAANANEVASTVSRLIFASPEFQFS